MSEIDAKIIEKAAERPGIPMTIVSRELIYLWTDQSIRARARVLAARGVIRLERDDGNQIRLYPATPSEATRAD